LSRGIRQRAWLATWLATVTLAFAQPADDVPWVRITSPTESRIEAPGVTHVEAKVDLGGQAVEQIEFTIDGETVFADDSEPYVFEWQNRRVGKFTLTAIAKGVNGEAVESLGVEFDVVPKRNADEALLIAEGSRWRYLDTGEQPDENWIGDKFDDTDWLEGPAQFGYGEGDEVTRIRFGDDPREKHVTTWFRKMITVGDVGRFDGLKLQLLSDDGALVFLNGHEIVRFNLPEGVITAETTTLRSGDPGFLPYDISPDELRNGLNVIAVEVHQSRPNSSDVSFDLELIGIESKETNCRPFVTLAPMADDLLIARGKPWQLAAEAFDLDGLIVRVEFFADEKQIGEVGEEPFEFDWSPEADGHVSLTTVAWDDEDASTRSQPRVLNVSSDTAPPSVAAVDPVPGRVTALTELTVTFSKPIHGADAADLLINELPSLQITAMNESGTKWRFEFAKPAYGRVNISWADTHGITDRFTPPHAFGITQETVYWEYDFVDITPPWLDKTLPYPGDTVSVLQEVVITFSEPVTGVDAADLQIGQQPAQSVTGEGSGPYRFRFLPQAEGAVSVTWAEDHAMRDLAGNAFQGGTWEVQVDPDFSDIVINEIMYHPASEDDREEYIELLNRDTRPVNLKGWRFTRGIRFDFPDVVIPASGLLVVAADPEIFLAKYPESNPAVGHWAGRLANSGEALVLEDAEGRVASQVAYADAGDWATRLRGPEDRGFHGWQWEAAHNGSGQSLELINPRLPNEFGQNWAASEVETGTPGQANSVRRSNIAPLIVETAHFPIVPKSTDSVRVSARVVSLPLAKPEVVLHFRDATSEEPDAFQPVPMRDDGQAGDAIAGDGFFTATLPPQPHATVVEFYLRATDALGQARTWPAPTLKLDGSLGQAANPVYLVDDSPIESEPLYRVVMTGAELRDRERITSGSRSDARMNATFISSDETGTECRYLVGVRNRGNGSRGRKPSNFRIHFRSDEPWKGQTDLNLNGQFSWVQHIGSVLALKSGAAAPRVWPVRVRLNDQDPTEAGSVGWSFGFYAAHEVLDSCWAEYHFPDDSGGNLYRARRNIAPSSFEYRGEEADSYRNTWFKATNTAEDDWLDLIEMLSVVDPEDELSMKRVREVINVEQWLMHFAVMAVFNNSESSLNTGFNDDYYFYRGVDDPRFLLVAYDTDTILGEGDTGSFHGATFFGAMKIPVLGRLLQHRDIEPEYRRTLVKLFDTVFSEDEFNAQLDRSLGHYVPEDVRGDIKSWMDRRRLAAAEQFGEQPESEGETLVALDHEWRFEDSGEAAADDWFASDFDDSEWNSGPGLLGHEDDQLEIPLLTPVDYQQGKVAYYFRTTFEFSEDMEGATARVAHYVDDGAVFYLNGEEFGERFRMPIDEVIDFETLAANGGDARRNLFTFDPALLKTGENTLAVEVHQASLRSSDVVFGLQLTIELESNQPRRTKPGVRLNEVTTLAGGTGWVELFNPTDATADIGGLAFTDDLAKPRWWAIPEDTAVEPGGFFRFALPTALPLVEGRFFLVDRAKNDTYILDSLRFGRLPVGYALGRVPDGSSRWMLTTPTPEKPNTPVPLANPLGLRINEWMASRSNGSDWLELFNPAPRPVELSGLTMSDRLAKRDLDPFPPLTFLEGNGYWKLIADAALANRADRLGFKLRRSGETIGLATPNGVLIDAVAFGQQQRNVSEGRYPDGEAQVVSFAGTPTPGRPNRLAKPINEDRELRLEITRLGGGLRLLLLGPDRLRVELQSRDTLGPAEWKPVQVIMILDGPAEWLLPVGTSVHQYYRLRALAEGE
jgi:hypothetical protein